MSMLKQKTTCNEVAFAVANVLNHTLRHIRLVPTADNIFRYRI